jgi:uncharacterized membrane protein
MEIHVNGTRIKMGKNRLEIFSDGVLAIIITFIVLELKAPHGDTVAVRCVTRCVGRVGHAPSWWLPHRLH